MTRQLPSLNALKHFEATARHLSFKRAADELFVSHGAVSKQVKVLEDYFDVPLFDRDTRKVRLTGAGRSLYPRVRAALDELDSACGSIRRSEGDTLNVSVMPSIAMRWLLPRFVKFNMANPNLTIRWINSVSVPDFDNDGLDMAIRSGSFAPPDINDFLSTIDTTMVGGHENVEAIYLMSEQPVPVCSPSFLTEEGPFVRPNQFTADKLVHMARRPDAWQDWLGSFGSVEPLVRRGREYGHFFLSIEAAIQGAGIALVPYVLVQDEINQGKLVLVGEEILRSSASFYLFISKKLRRSSNVDLFVDWITSEAAFSDQQTKTELKERYPDFLPFLIEDGTKPM